MGRTPSAESGFARRPEVTAVLAVREPVLTKPFGDERSVSVHARFEGLTERDDNPQVHYVWESWMIRRVVGNTRWELLSILDFGSNTVLPPPDGGPGTEQLAQWGRSVPGEIPWVTLRAMLEAVLDGLSGRAFTADVLVPTLKAELAFRSACAVATNGIYQDLRGSLTDARLCRCNCNL